VIAVRDNWVFLNGDKKPKGRIENGKYISVRYKKKHLFRLGNGYPIQTEILEWLDSHGIKGIVIIEKSMDGDKHYRATVREYLEGEELSMGFGSQRYVPLDRMGGADD